VIAAIKVVRVERKLGLKEAKDLVDAYIRSQPSLRQKMEQAQAEVWQKLKRGLISRTDRCRRRGVCLLSEPVAESRETSAVTKPFPHSELCASDLLPLQCGPPLAIP